MSNTILQAGWKLVPIEPNDEMQAAGAGAIRFATSPLNKLWTGNAVYRAQIAAAPAAPHAAAPMVWAAQLERAVRGLLPICGWSNMDEDDLILEACLGNGAAPLILFARAVLAGEVDMGIAPPEAPVWSACTEPDGRGYQQTVAMPGMPSATRDAAYDEIAALAVQWGDARIPNGGGNALRNFAEYVLARKSIAAPAPSLPAPSAWIDQFGNVFPLAAYSVDGTPNYHDQHKRGWSPLYRAQPAPVQQAAPSAQLSDQEIYEWAEGYQFSSKGNPHKMSFSRPRFIDAVRTILSHSPAAAPAQPAGLSEQNKLDAARAEYLYQVACVKPFIAPIVSKEKWLASIDAAILAAQAAP